MVSCFYQFFYFLFIFFSLNFSIALQAVALPKGSIFAAMRNPKVVAQGVVSSEKTVPAVKSSVVARSGKRSYIKRASQYIGSFYSQSRYKLRRFYRRHPWVVWTGGSLLTTLFLYMYRENCYNFFQELKEFFDTKEAKPQVGEAVVASQDSVEKTAVSAVENNIAVDTVVGKKEQVKQVSEKNDVTYVSIPKEDSLQSTQVSVVKSNINEHAPTSADKSVGTQEQGNQAPETIEKKVHDHSMIDDNTIKKVVDQRNLSSSALSKMMVEKKEFIDVATAYQNNPTAELLHEMERKEASLEIAYQDCQKISNDTEKLIDTVVPQEKAVGNLGSQPDQTIAVQSTASNQKVPLDQIKPKENSEKKSVNQEKAALNELSPSAAASTHSTIPAVLITRDQEIAKLPFKKIRSVDEIRATEKVYTEVFDAINGKLKDKCAEVAQAKTIYENAVHDYGNHTTNIKYYQNLKIVKADFETKYNECLGLVSEVKSKIAPLSSGFLDEKVVKSVCQGESHDLKWERKHRMVELCRQEKSAAYLLDQASFLFSAGAVPLVGPGSLYATQERIKIECDVATSFLQGLLDWLKRCYE